MAAVDAEDRDATAQFAPGSDNTNKNNSNSKLFADRQRRREKKRETSAWTTAWHFQVWVEACETSRYTGIVKMMAFKPTRSTHTNEAKVMDDSTHIINGMDVECFEWR